MKLALPRRLWITVAVAALMALSFAAPVFAISAKTAGKIDKQVVEAKDQFTKTVDGAQKLMGQANGILIFPKVYKAGIGIGGEHGKGVLQIGGKTVDYYSTSAASIGFQLGGQKKTVRFPEEIQEQPGLGGGC